MQSGALGGTDRNNATSTIEAFKANELVVKSAAGDTSKFVRMAANELLFQCTLRLSFRPSAPKVRSRASYDALCARESESGTPQRFDHSRRPVVTGFRLSLPGKSPGRSAGMTTENVATWCSIRPRGRAAAPRSPAGRRAAQLRQRLHPQLLHDAVAMRLDRALGRAELVGDLLVELAAHHQREHLALARRQRRHQRAQGGLRGWRLESRLGSRQSCARLLTRRQP
jgi:hypothetical protein